MTNIFMLVTSFRPTSSGTRLWLHLFFPVSYRNVEEMLAERGLELRTIRRWVNKFGPLFARELRTRRSRPTGRWHLDEMAVTIAGKRYWLGRAVDDQGKVLESR